MDERWRSSVNGIIPEISQYIGPLNAVIFDIDNTLIEFKTGRSISPVKSLYDYCISREFTIIILTARPSFLYLFTLTQLFLLGFHSFELILSNKIHTNSSSIGSYKLKQRERIQRRGYHILLNVGNKESDFQGKSYQYSCSV